mgnify:CR=1 FL=1
MPLNPTVRQLRLRLASRFGDAWSGVLTNALANGASSLTITHRRERAAFFNNAWLRCGADATAEEIPVTSYTPPTFTLAYASSVAVEHPVGAAYELHRRFSADQYNQALIDALEEAGNEAVLANLKYETLTWAQNTWEYTLPVNFKYISRVEFPSTANNGQIDQVFEGTTLVNALRVQPGIPRKLVFPRSFGATVGQTIRILGQGAEPIPTLMDTGIVQVDGAFLIAHAELVLSSLMAEGEGAQAQARRARLRDLAARAELARVNMSTEHRALPGVLIVP